MADVIRWLNDGPDAEAEVRQHLQDAGGEEALSAWRATGTARSASAARSTRPRRRSCGPSPTRGCWRPVRAPTTRPRALLDGGANTLYLCGTAHEQGRLASLFAAMLSELVGVVYELSAQTGKPLDPPLLLALYEAANTAAKPELDVVASTSGGVGIQLLTVFQDLAQVEARWGKRAKTIMNNHQAGVYCSGISDPETLSYVSGVVGEGEFRQRSETAAERGRGSSTEATTFRALTPGNVIREGRPGTALLVYGHRPPARIELRPWFRDRDLKAMVEGERP